MTDEDREFVDFFADEYWPLRRLGFLLTGNWHDADELAQEATARTFAAWRRLRRRDLAAAYARKVLVNRHRSLLRRARVEARYAVVHRQERYEPDLARPSFARAYRPCPLCARSIGSEGSPTVNSGPRGRGRLRAVEGTRVASAKQQVGSASTLVEALLEHVFCLAQRKS
jgi:Sigma-70 region 2